MTTIDNDAQIDETRETGGTRMIFWSAAWEMAKDYPFGNGYKGFNYLSHLYIPEDVATGNSRNRTVHSTWMEALSEIGYAGLLALFFMLWSSYKTTNKCKDTLSKQGDIDNFFKIIALQAAGLCFIISMTFLNRLRAEILYWLILYSAIAYNIYIVKPSTEQR
jgi:O-antigen ligase